MSERAEDNSNEIPESVVNVLKAIATSLSEALDEIKERLFALEVEMRTLTSRVDYLESIIDKMTSLSTTSLQRSSEKPIITSSLPLSESSTSPDSERRSITSSVSLTSSVRSISEEKRSIAQRDVRPSSDDRKSLEHLPKISGQSKGEIEEKRKEKQEILKALRLIDSL